MTHAEEQALYSKRHPERVKESYRKCWQKNKDKYKACSARWKSEHPEAVALHRAKYNENYYSRYPERKIAHNAVNHAIKSGSMSRGPCEVCGTTEGVHGHHDDYERPLDVRWLCYEHHLSLHRGTK
jgi:hypothetical protein